MRGRLFVFLCFFWLDSAIGKTVLFVINRETSQLGLNSFLDIECYYGHEKYNLKRLYLDPTFNVCSAVVAFDRSVNTTAWLQLPYKLIVVDDNGFAIKYEFVVGDGANRFLISEMKTNEVIMKYWWGSNKNKIWLDVMRDRKDTNHSPKSYWPVDILQYDQAVGEFPELQGNPNFSSLEGIIVYQSGYGNTASYNKDSCQLSVKSDDHPSKP